MTADTAEEKWNALMGYMAYWPYSPYTDLEYMELVGVIRSLRDTGTVRKLGDK